MWGKVKRAVINYFIVYVSMVGLAAVYFFVVSLGEPSPCAECLEGFTITSFITLLSALIFTVILYLYSLLRKEILDSKLLLVVCTLVSHFVYAYTYSILPDLFSNYNVNLDFIGFFILPAIVYTLSIWVLIKIKNLFAKLEFV